MWRFREGIARAVGIAVAQARGVPFDDSADVYEVDGPPALPEDRAAVLELYRNAMDAGALKLRDFVQYLQSAGILPTDVPAEQYAMEAAAEHGERNAEVVRLANGMGRSIDGDEPATPEPTTPDDEPNVPA